MIRTFIDAALRHIVTFIGGTQFAVNYWDGALADASTGLVLAIAGIIMSWIEKSKRTSSAPSVRSYN
ncbi:hypothetical protein [Microviridae sp.]|nr:hypothetical protein [Microviridae sp.]